MGFNSGFKGLKINGAIPQTLHTTLWFAQGKFCLLLEEEEEQAELRRKIRHSVSDRGE